MKILFAQGNPDARYHNSRHNIGFHVLDHFAAVQGGVWQDKPKFFAMIAEVTIDGEKVLLVKPTTYYNETGRSARAIADFYKCNPEDFLVVHDDLALPFGTIRTRQGGSSAGNNGLKSIQSHLGEDTWRLRIGIYNEQRNRIDDAAFVLGHLTPDEQVALAETLLPLAVTALTQFIDGTLPVTTYR